jgi:hypothetical protein
MDWPWFTLMVGMWGYAAVFWIAFWRLGKKIERQEWEAEVRREFEATRQEVESLRHEVMRLRT